jgi:hypothetical protein
MVDSTESGHVRHKRTAWSPELLVQPHTRRQAQKALGDALPQIAEVRSAVERLVTQLGRRQQAEQRQMKRARA